MSFGARALILLPTRELALQILKVGKELARGFQNGRGDHAGDRADDNSKQGENLRWGLVVGGEGLDEQFEMISHNPDVYVADLLGGLAIVTLILLALLRRQADCCTSS